MAFLCIISFTFTPIAVKSFPSARPLRMFSAFSAVKDFRCSGPFQPSQRL
jgi:hypothetical protein